MKTLRIALCALLVAATFGLNAQTRYIDEVFSTVTKTSNVVYGWNWSVLPTADDTSGTSFGPVTLYVDSLVADVYTPNGDNATDRPVILLSHAGSFLPSTFTGLPLGTKNDSCMIELCTRFAKLGYVAVSFDYRLGWNPLAADQEARAKGIILAVYKAMQDAKMLTRFMKANATTYGIDKNKVVLGGSNSGAYVALIANVLNQPSEINNPKFLDSLGNSFIDTTLWGNFDGYGGAMNNSDSSTIAETADFQLVLSLGGDVGDTSWVDGGENPIVAFHGVSDPGSPYETAVVIVAATQQPVIEVSGPGDFIPTSDALGNQDVLKGGNFCPGPASTDGNVYEGNYPFYGAGFEPWGWYNASTPLNPNASRARAMAYIDTIMSYFAPRAYRVLIDDSYSDPCVGIADLKVNDVQVELFPNPSASDITVSVQDVAHRITSVELYDVAGKLVRKENVQNETRYVIGRKGLDTGAYFVNIQFADGSQTYKRVIFE